MQAQNLPISTELRSADSVQKVDSVMQSLKEGCDVELWLKGHVTSVMAIADLGEGRYLIDVADDQRQGAPGGTVVASVILDTSTGVVKHTVWGGEKLANGFVVECGKKP